MRDVVHADWPPRVEEASLGLPGPSFSPEPATRRQRSRGTMNSPYSPETAEGLLSDRPAVGQELGNVTVRRRDLKSFMSRCCVVSNVSWPQTKVNALPSDST